MSGAGSSTPVTDEVEAMITTFWKKRDAQLEDLREERDRYKNRVEELEDFKGQLEMQHHELWNKYEADMVNWQDQYDREVLRESKVKVELEGRVIELEEKVKQLERELTKERKDKNQMIDEYKNVWESLRLEKSINARKVNFNTEPQGKAESAPMSEEPGKFDGRKSRVNSVRFHFKTGK